MALTRRTQERGTGIRIGLSSGYTETYWGPWFQEGKQLGGSERLVVEVAAALGADGHQVTVRLPYRADPTIQRGVAWVGEDSPAQEFDVLFCFDDFERHDNARFTALVACRSDPPRHSDFDQLVFLSGTHARLMGHPDRPWVGGGVDLDAYRVPLPRIPRRVLCASSPDRCPAAGAIGRAFDFVHTYKTVPGYATVEVSRDELVRLQQTAAVLIYPLDPRRPSDFFSMAVLEAMAAGTPVVVSNADSMAELWSDAAVVLPRPIDMGLWVETVEDVLADPVRWRSLSRAGKELAKRYEWRAVARRYLDVACS